ncbi:MAG: two-component system, OmpR family, phosphate regulon sensor histidine kinase PhoR [Parcubacteria group bacterium Gr01-1014_18]|nr:MAG: two-component system, OmpR family, phosphate regulon sensor histidine kinase PhoR [Parcubacteria group bacterium Greene0416_36]TSC80995.1 MAG: two-component system, OmpR family, phosphate regulon sensor histidine kinase PhoR [Parcubacteria group bacterium Gr01-1014_18]TSC98882.1 MAG: two-component system, OmpR family, phosphate regulon sensor histidine kinase PhoR [Parcubacteria group bacterium Greene1014_20]TSD06532.1 MAG: two-component system, OmpR family, phosphate regulon sensor hist
MKKKITRRDSRSDLFSKGIKNDWAGWQDVLDSLTNGILMFDLRKKVILTNVAMLSLTGLPREAFTVSDFSKLFKKRELDLEAELSKVITAGEPIHIAEAQLSFFFYEINVTPVFDDARKLIGGALILHDITERKNEEERRLELDSLKNKFITIVSHQLRTPLNAVRWNLEMLLARELGAFQKGQEEVLKISYCAAKEIILRINDLMTAMDIEGRSVHLQKEKVAFLDLVHSSFEEFRIPCELKKIQLSMVSPPEELPLVNVDPNYIRDVLYKLMINAVDYTHEGGKISVKVDNKKKDKIRFEIKDTGIGIPESEQEHIFQRFHRAYNASASKPDASGLGLYIAKQIIAAHGGNIQFESKEGKGTTFWFELPCFN